ncbi:hypothetical protein MtrunA17_Chr8g0345121 [Medicago truncatula]|uniref:Uncharacterized protein n=1 Tax=Medicago truncatula TaxID=3880 RepID=A0A396GHB9_MEDTR|nr:hypothetical protein MtrunA17_Chr8g0345121 [Medicago truncatula]
MTDAFQNIKSGMHTYFPEYIFRINAIMVVNERNLALPVGLRTFRNVNSGKIQSHYCGFGRLQPLTRFH